MDYVISLLVIKVKVEDEDGRRTRRWTNFYAMKNQF